MKCFILVSIKAADIILRWEFMVSGSEVRDKVPDIQYCKSSAIANASSSCLIASASAAGIPHEKSLGGITRDV